MPRRRLAWRIAVAYVALIVGVVAGLGGYLAVAQRAALMDQLSGRLEGEARLIALAAAPALAAGDRVGAEALVRATAPTIGARVTLIAADGVVLGDSEADARTMENHAGRPEVAAVLGGAGQGASTRHSETVERDYLYVGVPVEVGGRTVGVARLARDTVALRAELGRATLAALAAAAAAGLLATLVAVVLAGRISRPVARLTRAARALAQGDLTRPVGPLGDDEIGELGHQFDLMAARLRDTIETLSTDRARLRAVLAAMADGLVLLDEEERIMLANGAAAELLGLPAEVVSPAAAGGGRRLIEVVRDHELYELVQQALARRRLMTDLVRLSPSGRHLRITATPMPGGGAAALLLVQDVTEIRRAETIRRDFAANVSHELKTPIASLKALVETLEDGAIEDGPVARDFLQRMHVEVDRLAQLVNELLELARIESGRARMTFEPRDAAAMVAAAVERLRPQADRAGVELAVRPSSTLPPVRADGSRIEGVVVNLVHNAIKFTPVGGRVEATLDPVELDGRPCLRVSVADTGVGIPPDALERLFERFYKADKSRASSGTGLGLAIVKHVVHAHGGQVGVESEPGRGSTFWFTLPLAVASPGERAAGAGATRR